MNLKIRNANDKDKIDILKFCKNTFSWGDYVEHVWDYWLSEGHLFLAENPSSIGICHALYSKDQIWIEGIRVDPNFRRQNIASELVKHAEKIGLEKDLLTSFMLIDIHNSTSLSMANSLDYEIFETWKFYTLTPKINLKFDVSFEKNLNLELYNHYVKSWRWIPFDDDILSSLHNENRIIKSKMDKNNSVAIITDSEHFEKTLIITIFSNSDTSVLEILSYLQNLGKEKDYERIQILTKEKLPTFNSLEHKLSFHLMKKSMI